MKTTYSKIALIIIGVTSIAAIAANTVDPAFTGTKILAGDDNSVTGTPRMNGLEGGPQMIAGQGNILVNTDSSQVFGGANHLTDSDMTLVGEGNVISNTFGNVFGDVNNVDTGTSYGSANLIGNGSAINGVNNDLVGSYSIINGNSSSVFGTGASVNADNSLSLGYGSTNTRNNSVSFGSSGGERQLTNVAAGTEDTDVTNLKQVRDADAATLSSAKGYTDTRETAINSRTDGLISTEQSARTAGDAATLTSANEFTSARETVINSRMDSLLATEKSDRITGDADTLAQSGSYTDKQTAVAISTANTYTDAREQAINSRTDGLVANEKSERVAGDAETLSSANSYTNTRETAINQRTDTLINNEQGARIEGDKRTLQAANNYTNNKFSELNERVNRNERRANAGIAGAMAMTAIPYLNNYVDNSFGMATSTFRGETAIASGYQRQINPYVNVRLSSSWDTSNGVGVAAGVAVGW